MQTSRCSIFFITAALLGAMLASGCGAGQVPPAQPTAIPPTPAPATAVLATDAPATAIPATATAAELPPTPTAAPATATTEPTLPPTPPPSETPLPPTATFTPMPTLDPAKAFSAWCLPEGISPLQASDPANPPESARHAALVDGALEVDNLPYSICVFTYTFDQPVEEGLTMQVYELRGRTPWLTAELAPLEGQPNTVAASARHLYIVAPPLYDVSYDFAVVDAAGVELRRDRVNLHRWKPELCWNGIYPSLKTGLCNLPQDLHPWDPSYGTPIPTFPPKED